MTQTAPNELELIAMLTPDKTGEARRSLQDKLTSGQAYLENTWETASLNNQEEAHQSLWHAYGVASEILDEIWFALHGPKESKTTP